MLKDFMDLNDAGEKRAAIKRFMEQYGLKVAPWCKRAGIQPSTLYDFLSGKNNDLTYGTLQKLARAVGVTVAVIMGEVGLKDSSDGSFEHRKNSAETEEIIQHLAKLHKSTRKHLHSLILSIDPESKNNGKK